MKIHKFWLSFLLISFSLANTNWTFLNTTRTGARSFIKSHPEDNGKDVVIIILDTGVDMGVPGLDALPDGGVKVIDVQDFSGEGDIYFSEASYGEENGEKYLATEDGVRLFNYDRLKLTPVDSIYYIGVLREEHFKNTVIPDVNNNGKTDDVFAFTVFNSKEGWVAYIDLDGDGNLNDEEPVWNYKIKHQAIRFRGRDTETKKNLATFGINIFPDENRINFHYDGSSHGTHVAGIAAGYRLNGQDGLNGIAPGAKIISLKIGDCTLAGGATTTGSMVRAYEYGIDFAKSYDGPVVFNMSFGIGSEIEGRASMEYTLNEFLLENEKLMFCVSAGNEGPGISTVGLPAAAQRVLTVGALNVKESARDVYGAHLSADKIFVFSSRGGELNKPDIVAPGSASSSVPPYSSSENKWGTSMAAPQATGAVALLMSAAYHAGLPVIGSLIKKAIVNSADPLKGYTMLDQGAGVINIPRAFEYYQKYIKRNEQKKRITYRIETLSPIFSDEVGPAAYWRFGSYAPDKNHKQRFKIYPEFENNWTADQKNKFYRAFDLRTTAPWIKLNKKSTYIKGQKPAIVDVYFDPAQMKNKGLYTGKVVAYRKDWSISDENKEFELWCTVIKPLQFTPEKHYRFQSDLVKIKPGDIYRIFFEVPVEAKAATIQLFSEGRRFSNVIVALFDPQGRDMEKYVRLDSEKENQDIIQISGDDLQYGVYEMVLYADFRNEETSYCKYAISFSGLEVRPSTITRLRISNGDKPRGKVRVFNYFDQPIICKVNGNIYGWERVNEIDEESTSYDLDFSVGEEVEKVTFELELPPEVFNLMTDFAINIRDYDGKILKADGLTYRKAKISFIPPTSGDYYLELIPAFAEKEAQHWTAKLTESYYLFDQLAVEGSRTVFYPKIEKTVRFKVDGTLPVAPDGFYLFGELRLNSLDKYRFKQTVPMHLYTELR